MCFCTAWLTVAVFQTLQDELAFRAGQGGLEFGQRGGGRLGVGRSLGHVRSSFR